MPSLWLLWPAYALFNSPAFLIGIQLAQHSPPGFLLYRIALPLVDRRLALALVAAFLFSRRSHSAITSVFYIECLEPAVVLLLSLRSRQAADGCTGWRLSSPSVQGDHGACTSACSDCS